MLDRASAFSFNVLSIVEGCIQPYPLSLSCDLTDLTNLTKNNKKKQQKKPKNLGKNIFFR